MVANTVNSVVNPRSSISSTVFTACAARGVRAGCLLAVSDTLLGGRERVDHEGLVAIGEKLGTVAVEALTQ